MPDRCIYKFYRRMRSCSGTRPTMQDGDGQHLRGAAGNGRQDPVGSVYVEAERRALYQIQGNRLHAITGKIYNILTGHRF